MVRLAILLVLLCLTVWEWRSGEHKVIYWLSLLGLYVFFSLRYGQGTDYLTYMSIYATVPPLQTLPYYGAYAYNTIEIGFFYLVSFFRMLGVHYVLFIAIMNAVSFFCIHRFIKRFSPLPMFSLAFFFAVYSLTYVESTVRQMLAMCVALGWVYIDWTDGRRLRALIGVLVAALIHTSAVVLLVLPILFWHNRRMYLIEWKPRMTVLMLALLAAGAIVVNVVNLTPVIEMLPDRIAYKILSYYRESGRFSVMALLNRGLFMAIVLALGYMAREKLTDREKFLFNLYCVGFGIYLVFMSFDLIASRTSVYLRVVDFCLIPLLMYKNREALRRVKVALPVMLALVSFLYVKDISAIMDFAQYYGNNPLQYPYITVFNADAIFDAKFVNVKNANAMNAYQTGGLTWDEYYQTLMRKPFVRSPYVPY